MAIQSSDIVCHKAQTMNQTSSTGGKMSNVTVANNVIGAVVDDITEAERSAGATRKYKLFYKVGNSEGRTYQNALLFLGYPLEGDCVASAIAGNFTDVWSDVSAGRKYGCANLKAATSIAVDATSAVVNTQGASFAHFQTGDTVAITDQLDPTDITGHVEFKTLTNVAWNGDEATLTFDTGAKYAYASSRVLSGATIKTRIASCLSYGNVLGSLTVTDKVSAAGTYDATKVTVDSIAGITQTFTFTFDSATTFNVAGDTLGSLAAGSTSSNYAPQNGDYSRPYLTVAPSFWTGTWASGNSVKINTNPCAMPIWVYLNIPSGADAMDLEKVAVWGTGNSGSL